MFVFAVLRRSTGILSRSGICIHFCVNLRSEAKKRLQPITAHVCAPCRFQFITNKNIFSIWKKRLKNTVLFLSLCIIHFFTY